MGVPSFFRWLQDRYPYLLSNCREDYPKSDQDHSSIDTSKSNPNGVEYDNLYLDMNAIIHPCCHPDDKEAPETEELMIEEIFKYLDRVIAIVRPRKLLYLAIDGVAPRAKMNQQRARRFKTAREEEIKKQNAKTQPVEFGQEQGDLKKKSWDSNVITPGTVFMDKVSQGIRYYIHQRMNTHKGWKNLNVIFSDANVPGEGEHKIAEFIRVQRLQPNWNPNTKHVIYGLDADLIMLALATHEPHFAILREKVFPRGKNYDVDKKEMGAPEWIYKPFQFLHIDILRQHLKKEFYCLENIKFYDFERIIDDFVFICFFVGNDFLPHLPSLDIREGAIDVLISIYKRNLEPIGGFLTQDGSIHFDRVQVILKELSVSENEIFKSRMTSQSKRRSDTRKRQRQGEEEMRQVLISNPHLVTKLGDPEKEKKRKVEIEQTDEMNRLASRDLKSLLDLVSIVTEKTFVPQAKLESQIEETPIEPSTIVKIDPTETLQDPPSSPDDIPTTPLKETVQEVKTFKEALAEIDPESKDRLVNLGESGWKDRYYKLKFQMPIRGQFDESHEDIFKSYMEGLAWVMKYYYDGCPSWGWYYRYHYAPFSSDLTNIADYKIEFEKGEPYKPLSQLLAIFPSNSSHALPTAYAKLMTDPNSIIAHFYPKDFEIDLNGKRFEHQGVVLLPFIDENKLLQVLTELEPTLTQEEVRRNSLGQNQLYCYYETTNALANAIVDLSMGGEVSVKIPGKFYALQGTITNFEGACEPSGTYNVPFSSENLKPVLNNLVLCANFILPESPKHQCSLLPGVKVDPGLIEKASEQERVKYESVVSNLPTSFGKLKSMQHVNPDQYDQRMGQHGDPRMQDKRVDSRGDPRSDPRRDNRDSRDNHDSYRSNDRRDYRDDRYDNRRDDYRNDRRDYGRSDNRNQPRSEHRDPRGDQRSDPREDRRGGRGGYSRGGQNNQASYGSRPLQQSRQSNQTNTSNPYAVTQNNPYVVQNYYQQQIQQPPIQYQNFSDVLDQSTNYSLIDEQQPQQEE